MECDGGHGLGGDVRQWELPHTSENYLLKEMGYKGEEVVYMSNRDYDWMYKASLSQTEQWRKAGINVRLTFQDWPSVVQQTRSKEGWNMSQTGWSPRMDPIMLTTQFKIAFWY